MKNPLSRAISFLRLALFGVSPEEIRLRLEKLEGEIRSTRAELKGEIAAIRRELDALREGEDRVRGAERPVAEA